METENLYPIATRELADKKAAALAPKNIEAWHNFNNTVFQESALPGKTKQLPLPMLRNASIASWHILSRR